MATRSRMWCRVSATILMVVVAEVMGLKIPVAPLNAQMRVEVPATPSPRPTPTPVPVYIFGNRWFPLSTTASSLGQIDLSVTLAQEFLSDARLLGIGTDFGGVFSRLQGDANEWSTRYGDLGRKKIVVIAADGTFVGAFDTETFLEQNNGFWVNFRFADNYNTYKDRIITLSNGVTVKVLESAMASPLLIDLNHDGSPSLLARSGWSKDHAPSFDLTNYRPFKFGGAKTGSWEWIGSDDGLLVWLPNLTIGKTGDSSALFGNETWNKSWQHGFEALATLDANHDDTLRGEELKNLGVWQDKNGDAIAQQDEVMAVVQAGISEISLKVQGGERSPWIPGGVTINGARTDVWDWWSAANPVEALKKVGSITWVAERVPELLVVSYMPLAKDSVLPMLEKGTIELYQDQAGAWFVRTISKAQDGKAIDLLYPATAGTGMLRWGLKDSKTVANHGIFQMDGKITGVTALSDGRFSTWKIVSSEGATPWRQR